MSAYKAANHLRLTAVVSICFSILAMIGQEGVSSAAADSHTPAPVLENKNIVAVVPRHWPPQFSTDKNGKPTGFGIDVMEAVAARAGLSVTYKVVESFPEAVSTLERGDADVIPNSGIVPQRLKTSSFTAPVETFQVSIFVRDDTYDLSNEADLIGRKLAVVKANIGLFMFGKRKDIDVEVYPDIRAAEIIIGIVHNEALANSAENMARAILSYAQNLSAHRRHKEPKTKILLGGREREFPLTGNGGG